MQQPQFRRPTSTNIGPKPVGPVNPRSPNTYFRKPIKEASLQKTPSVKTRTPNEGGNLVPVISKSPIEKRSSSRFRNDVYVPDAIDKANESKLKSKFAQHRLALKEAQNEPGEKSMMIVYQALLDMVLDLIPLAEEKYRENKAERAAYALNVYLNNVREIQNDMRSLHDFSQIGFRIIEIVAHRFTLIAQNLVSEKNLISQDIMIKLSHSDRHMVETAINMMVQNQGRYLHETLKSLRDSILGSFIVQTSQNKQNQKQTVIKHR